MFHTVESYEFLTFLRILDHNFVAGDFCHIKAVERLPHAVEKIVGDIDYVVDRAESDGRKSVLKPFRRFLDCHATHCNSGVSGTCVGVFNVNCNAPFGGVDGKCTDFRTVEIAGFSVGAHPCGEVTCHTVVRCCVDTVWGEVYFEHVV